MTKTEKLIELLSVMTKNNCTIAKCHNVDGSVNTIKIVGVCTDKAAYGDCIGVYGDICMEIQPLEDDAKITITDEYIEVNGSVSGLCRFYPDGERKSVFELLLSGGEA